MDISPADFVIFWQRIWNVKVLPETISMCPYLIYLQDVILNIHTKLQRTINGQLDIDSQSLNLSLTKVLAPCLKPKYLFIRFFGQFPSPLLSQLLSLDITSPVIKDNIIRTQNLFINIFKHCWMWNILETSVWPTKKTNCLPLDQDSIYHHPDWWFIERVKER